MEPKISKKIKQPSKSHTPSETLIHQIALLTKELRLANSLPHKFTAGLLTGLGTAIGATLLVAILIFILTQLSSIELLRPFVENIVNMVRTSYR